MASSPHEGTYMYAYFCFTTGRSEERHKISRIHASCAGLPLIEVSKRGGSLQKHTDQMALEIGIRLSEKRMFPCLERDRWLKTRDIIYEEIMTQCWNPKLEIFTQSIESPDALDSSVLIMPLVFFVAPNDPRMLSTIRHILLPPEKGKFLVGYIFYMDHVLMCIRRRSHCQ